MQLFIIEKPCVEWLIPVESIAILYLLGGKLFEIRISVTKNE